MSVISNRVLLLGAKALAALLLSSCGKEPQLPEVDSAERNASEVSSSATLPNGWRPLLDNAYRISREFDGYSTTYETSKYEMENSRAGSVITGTGRGSSSSYVSVLQTDGKLVAAGRASNTTCPSSKIA